jgi:hypothetical protein
MYVFTYIHTYMTVLDVDAELRRLEGKDGGKGSDIHA